MATDNLTKKLDGLISKEPSKWLQDAEWRNANRNWLKKSAKIALLVLDRMDELGWSQKDLAKVMGTSQQYISKLCKGHENLTLKNIALLEEKLGIDLSIGKEELQKTQRITIQDQLYTIIPKFEIALHKFYIDLNTINIDNKYRIRTKNILKTDTKRHGFVYLNKIEESITFSNA